MNKRNKKNLIARVNSNPEKNCIYCHRKEYRYKILKEFIRRYTVYL